MSAATHLLQILLMTLPGRWDLHQADVVSYLDEASRLVNRPGLMNKTETLIARLGTENRS